MGKFKIAAAQVGSVRGDITRNLRTHAEAIEVAAEQGVAVLIFPELSLTGYEPDLAAELAFEDSDRRMEALGESAKHHQMTVVIGAPLITAGSKPAIGAIVFAPDGSSSTYAKMHLGSSESAYFKPGCEPKIIESHGQSVGLSICADSSATSHPQAYAARGATVYAAGMFLNAEWYETDAPRLAAYAPAYRMLVVMANHAASVGTYRSVGRSAIWAPDGTLLVQAAGTENALVIATCELGSWSGVVIPL